MHATTRRPLLLQLHHLLRPSSTSLRPPSAAAAAATAASESSRRRCDSRRSRALASASGSGSGALHTLALSSSASAASAGAAAASVGRRQRSAPWGSSSDGTGTMPPASAAAFAFAYPWSARARPFSSSSSSSSGPQQPPAPAPSAAAAAAAARITHGSDRQALERLLKDKLDEPLGFLDEGTLSIWRGQEPHVRCLYYAAEGQGGELLGFLTLYEVERDPLGKHERPHLLNLLFVQRKYRRTGVAVELIRRAASELQVTALCTSEEYCKVCEKAGLRKGESGALAPLVVMAN